MHKLWFDAAWDDYVGWQSQDRKTLKRVNALIQSIERNGYSCIGNPEPLCGNLSGWWRVRIDEKNRIVFRIANGELVIASCKGHYET